VNLVCVLKFSQAKMTPSRDKTLYKPLYCVSPNISSVSRYDLRLNIPAMG